MKRYLVESYDWQVDHAGHSSVGALGKGPGSEKIYLHVISLAAAEIAQLSAREDEHGNREHDRLALPANDIWWLAIDSAKCWPKAPNNRIRSRCDLDEAGKPIPRPLSDDEAAALQQVGVALPPG